MRPVFFESDGNFRLHSDLRPLTLNLTLKVMNLQLSLARSR